MAGRDGSPIELVFDRGSLLVSPPPAEAAGAFPPSYLHWDDRVGAYRGLAIHYRALVGLLTRGNFSFSDRARDYPEIPLRAKGAPPPFAHQLEALQAWSRGKRGVAELPTGAGKTRVALLAMAEVGRGTLILVPTLELVSQWCAVVEKEFGISPGVVGGGSFEIAPVTVCTYASAYRHGERFGDRFGLAIFDECHHLCGVGYARIAEGLIAPYRLGLSATVERPDGRHLLLDSLIGPRIYTKSIGELSGSYLAEYSVQVRYAHLNPQEEAGYRQARETYLAFAREKGLPLGSAADWQRFIFVAGRTPEGREALAAYFRQKNLAFAAEQKFGVCAELLQRHAGQRTLIFTNDNRTAYEVSRRFLLPLITHQTRIAERRAILARFRDGRWPTVVTSKVLNEGVDVPAAAVAIILSGNASVREHVQRLGRILRRDGEKKAVLYEVLTRHTGEEGTSERRRRHDAYR